MIAALCYLAVAGAEALAASYKTERPIWSAKAARSAFLAEVAKFADKEMFAIRIGEPRGDGEHFIVDMSREEVDIIILNPFNDPTPFRCAFYETGALPVASGVIEALASRLKEELGSVPGVVFK